MKNWNAQRTSLTERLADGRRYASDKTIEVVDLPNFLEAVIRPGDRVCLEGDNQKQADVLAAALANVDPAKVHELHMVQSGVVLPEHLDVFDKGIARKLDYSYSGPQAARIARMLFGGKIELGAVHTYLELFTRYFIDLTPNVALIAAVSADKDGNLYTGPKHRGHADGRGSDDLQERSRRSAGGRDRRPVTPRRYSRRSSTFCRRSEKALLQRPPRGISQSAGLRNKEVAQ
jgi:hypothetical protein